MMLATISHTLPATQTRGSNRCVRLCSWRVLLLYRCVRLCGWRVLLLHSSVFLRGLRGRIICMRKHTTPQRSLGKIAMATTNGVFVSSEQSHLTKFNKSHIYAICKSGGS